MADQAQTTASVAAAADPRDAGGVADTLDTPTSDSRRISSLDTLRGVAVLGILIMNIIVFGAPFAFLTDPSLFGPPSAATFWSWLITALFFEGTFRTIFGILFGAGLYLFFTRIEARAGERRARALYLRRSIWLILFGLVDAYLFLWVGDILFLYGVIGLVLWLFRGLGTRGLMIWIAVFAAISLFMKFGNAFGTDYALQTMSALEARQAEGQTLSEAELENLEAARAQLQFAAPPPEDMARESAQIASGYRGATEVYYGVSVFLQTKGLLFFMLWDSTIAMLLGIMLFKAGALTLDWSLRRYALLAVAGYALAVPLRLWHLLDYAASDYNLAVYTWHQMWYDLERVAMALGHIGLIMALIKMGRMPLQRRLAATGQMALTNYLMQSLICLVLFVLLGMYGAYSRTGLYAVMLAIWALQLTISPIWLARFRFGPAEWLWRSLTYAKPQAMRRSEPA